jgi:hypothetical protein
MVKVPITRPVQAARAPEVLGSQNGGKIEMINRL